MAPRKSEERALEELLRSITAMVLLALVTIITLSVIFFEPKAETTLLLGLAASIIGAMVTLLGVQLALSRNRDDS